MRSRPVIHRSSFTLVELLVSLAISTVVLGGLSAAILIAMNAVDDGGGPLFKTRDAVEAVDQIAGDLTCALAVTERTSKTLALTAPDRTGDGLPENIRYAWSGVAGDPLTRQYNGSDALSLAEDVRHFEMSYILSTRFPPPQACCYRDGSCQDQQMDTCFADGGEPFGPGTDCTSVTCPRRARILFVVVDATGVTAQELARQTLMESWDFEVTLIAASAGQSEFDGAVAIADAAYVCETIDETAITTKLRNVTIGVINEEISLNDELGFGRNYAAPADRQDITITDNNHDITSPFASGFLTICSSTQPLAHFTSQWSPDLTILGAVLSVDDTSKPSLSVLDVGAALEGGGAAPGRRVQLPWAAAAFDFNALTEDGRTIMKRAIEWAAGLEPGPGGGADCGNGTCDPGEDCNGCPGDCRGEDGGSKWRRYCCGNGILESAEDDGSICDGNP